MVVWTAVVAMAGLCDARQKDVQGLILRLEVSDVYTRVWGARELGKLGPKGKAAVPALIQALDDESPDVRKEVAAALGKIGPDANEAIPALILRLEDTETSVCARAVEALARIGPETEDVVPALVRALSDPSSTVRSEALRALGSIGPTAEQAIPSIINLLNTDRSVHHVLTDTLAAIGPMVIPEVTDALRNEDHNVRCMAAEALGKMGPLASPAVNELKAALHDKNTGVQAEAAWALGEIGPDAKGAVLDLTEMVGHDKKRLANAALGALGKIGPDAKEAVPAVIAALKAEYSDTRRSAARSLGNIGPVSPDVVPALAIALQDKDSNARLDAAKALWKIGPGAGKAVPALIEAMDDEDLNVRVWSTRALSVIGPDAAAAVPALIEMLDHKGVGVRWYAREALFNIGPGAEQAVPVLIRVLGIGNRRELKSIERIDPEFRSSAAYLIMSLNERDPDVRMVSVEALKKNGTRIRQQLQELLEYPSYKVMAESWLSGLNGQNEELVKRLESEDVKVREAAALALCEYGDVRAVETLLKAAARTRGYQHRIWRTRALRFRSELPDVLEQMRSSTELRLRVLADYMAVEISDPNRIEEFNDALRGVMQFVRKRAWGERDVQAAGKALATYDSVRGRRSKVLRFGRYPGARETSPSQERTLRQDFVPLLEAVCLFNERIAAAVAAHGLLEFEETELNLSIQYLLKLRRVGGYRPIRLDEWGL
jgi:HEAT repeat protein